MIKEVFLEEEAECKEPARTVTSELVETDNSVESLKQKNENLVQALQEANEWQEEQDATIEQLSQEVNHLTADAGAAADLCRQLKKEKERAKKLWSLSCRRASEQEELIVAKELEIEEMKLRLEESASHAGGGSHVEDSTQMGKRIVIIIPPVCHFIDTVLPCILRPKEDWHDRFIHTLERIQRYALMIGFHL